MIAVLERPAVYAACPRCQLPPGRFPGWCFHADRCRDCCTAHHLTPTSILCLEHPRYTGRQKPRPNVARDKDCTCLAAFRAMGGRPFARLGRRRVSA